MAWCPNCKEEYRDGFTKCAECGADLLNKLPENTKSPISDITNAPLRPNFPNSASMDEEIVFEPCFLISVSDKVQSGILAGLLHDSGIAFFTKDKETGGFMSVYMGYSIFGIDIYVAKSNYAQAKELVDAYLISLDNNVDVPDEPPRFYTIRKNIMRIIIFITLFLLLLSFVFTGATTFFESFL